MSTNKNGEENKLNSKSNDGAGSHGWLTKLSLSHWLAIIAIPLGLVGALYLFWQEGKTRVDVYIPARKLPAYHQIQPNDIVRKPYVSKSVPSGILKTSEEIVGRYTLTQLSKEKPLTDNQLGVKVNPACLANAIAVSLPATPAMTLGANLRAGDIVSITFSSPATQKGASPSSPTVFSDILVLDVKAVPQANTASTSVIVIALPRESQREFATQLAGTIPLVSRSLSREKTNNKFFLCSEGID